MDFGMPMMNINELIDLITNEDLMFQYQGVMQLRELLSMSNEQSLGSFPMDRVCKRLIELLGQPVVSEFSHEIKYFAMSCLHSLMDIYPNHIPNLVGQNLIENLSEAMEAAAAFGLEEMNQVCIKAIEQISNENPRAILNHGKSLTLCINIIDFLDAGFQKRVLKIFLNVADHSISEEQFNTSLVPTLPILCQMLSLNCEDDISKAERVSVILKRMTDSFTRFQSPFEKFDRIGAMCDCLSQIGVVEIIMRGLQNFADNEVSLIKKLAKSKEQQQKTQEDQIMSQNINTQQQIKRVYSQVTISNFLKILTFSCKYTQQIVMQLISGGILETLETLIPDEDAERANYIYEVLGLLESLFPCPETKDGTFELGGIFFERGNEQILNTDALITDPRNDKFKQEVKNLENEKRSFFIGFEDSLKKQLMTKLLPKIFSIYKSNMQTNVRTRCLNLIDKILHIVPSDLIQSQIDPVQFAQFLQMIFLSGNGQQVLLSLRMIERVQDTKQLKFAVQFIRQGISHFVSQLQDPKNVKQYDEVEQKLADPFSSNHFLPKQFQNEKEILLQRIKEIQHLISMSGEDLTPQQKNDLDQILSERMNALINLKTKERQITEAQAIKRTQEQKLKDVGIKEGEKEAVPMKTSELIIKEAQNIVKLYFENGELISKIKAQFPEEIQALQQQKKLAQALLEESIQESFDIEKTQKLMQEVAQIITSPLGISNFEFTESGLLKALQQFLTIPPSQSLQEIYSEEEVKINEKSQMKSAKQLKKNLTKKDAKCLILRLKVFAHVMCHEVSQEQANQVIRIPFLALISQCHAVISVNEPILFSKDNKVGNVQSTVDALKQLNKHIVVNLVYDPDRKNIEKSILAAKKEKIVQADSDEMSLAKNAEIRISNHEDEEKLENDCMKDLFPQIDRKIKSVALPFGHLSAAEPKDEKSRIFKRRHKLFQELNQVPLNIQQRDNIWLLEDFLLKRIKTSDDVKKLVLHTRPAYSSGLFNQLTEGNLARQFETPLEEIEKYELQELHSRCLERIDYLIAKAQDSEEFHLLLPNTLKELSETILESTKKFNFDEKELELLFKHVARDTEEMIKEHELGQASGDEDQEMMDRDANEIAYYIQIKVLDFIKMIEKLREMVDQKLNGAKKSEDQLMEETKEQKLNFEDIIKDQIDEWDTSEMEKKILTKIEQTIFQPLIGHDLQSDHSPHQLQSPAIKIESVQQQQEQNQKPDGSLSKSQQSDIEMTDEQNLNSVSQISGDKNNEAIDEAMKDDIVLETKLEDLLQMMPGKITKEKMDEKMKQINQTHKLMQQQIQKFKQQHIYQQIAPDKAIPLNQPEQSQDEDFMKMNIEELIQMNQGEDIEIEFFCNGKKLELNTSFFEMFKRQEDPNPKSDKRKPEQKLSKNPVDHIREVLQNLHGSQGINLPNYHTIYFFIKDKKNQQVSDRKDSLADLAFRIQRSKSQVQDDISLSSVNLVVQQLIDREFQVFPKDSRSEVRSKEDETDKDRDRNMQNLEHALKILKILYFIHKDAQLLTQEGINFLLVKSSTDKKLKQLVFDDIELKNVTQHQIKGAAFRHSKLDDNMVKQIQNPYKLVQGGLSDTLKKIFQSCSFLFDFETKLLYFKLVTFIGIDINRSLYFLQNYLNQKGLLGKTGDEQHSNPMSFFTQQGKERDEGIQNKVKKQPFKIDRKKILDEAFAISNKLQKRCLLEIEYNNEAGTGLGPTLEFFTLLADEIKKVENGLLWKETSDKLLFPNPLSVTPGNLEKTRRICSLFQLAGTFVAKSIIDDRLIDLPFSPLMWDLILGKQMNLFDLRRIDPLYFKTFSKLQLLANRKKEIDEMVGLDQEARKRLLGSIKTPENESLEDYHLYFVCPTASSIELIKDGSEEKVTLDNLQDYIDLSLHFIFHETINMQLKSFKKGFSQILPIESLRPFRTDEEIETLTCGSLNSEQFTNFDYLMGVIVPDHGFDQKSRVFRDFIRYMMELKKDDRPQLIKFMTGSRRLPCGGFAALTPHLTVVLKKVEGKADQHLPSISTCAKYLKLPDYSSYDILKQKFDQAMWEGADNFTLS